MSDERKRTAEELAKHLKAHYMRHTLVQETCAMLLSQSAELKAKDERIAELDGVRNECERQYQEKVAEIIRLLNRIEELERDLGALRASTSYSMRMQVESHCERVEAERDAALLRLGNAEGLLIEAEGMLCDPQGGPAANRCAEQIREFLASAVEGQIPAQDAAAYHAFFVRYGMSPKMRPSCLVCGREPGEWPPGIQHAELPGIIVCTPCRDAGQAARAVEGRGPKDVAGRELCGEPVDDLCCLLGKGHRGKCQSATSFRDVERRVPCECGYYNRDRHHNKTGGWKCEHYEKRQATASEERFTDGTEASKT